MTFSRTFLMVEGAPSSGANFETRGACASRVLVAASRRDELSLRELRPRRFLRFCDVARKFVSAGRRNQHAGRVRSPIRGRCSHGDARWPRQPALLRRAFVMTFVEP